MLLPVLVGLRIRPHDDAVLERVAHACLRKSGGSWVKFNSVSWRARATAAPPVKHMCATSGCHATARTSAVWPCSTARHAPVLTSLRGGHVKGKHVHRLAGENGKHWSRCSCSVRIGWPLHYTRPGASPVCPKLSGKPCSLRPLTRPSRSGRWSC